MSQRAQPPGVQAISAQIRFSDAGDLGADPFQLHISLHVICGELLNAVNCPSGELLEAVNCISLFLQLKTTSGSPVRPYPFWLKRFGSTHRER